MYSGFAAVHTQNRMLSVIVLFQLALPIGVIKCFQIHLWLKMVNWFGKLLSLEEFCLS